MIQNSPLYKSEGIGLNQEWDFEAFDQENDDQHSEENIDFSEEENIVETWAEETNTEDRTTGNTDTMLQSVDFREFNQILSVAPGENNIPLSIF